jgi:UDP-N-acetylglucosamine 2-epimerase (non-hydrolysing)
MAVRFKGAQFSIVNVVGARPNFMKIAPLMAEMSRYPEIRAVLVHTGQHYDEAMSRLFFQELEIPAPDINLEVGSASHAVQTALIMQRFEPVLLKEKPELVLVVGDVNSTLACALTSVKLGIPVAHVEAGLRSFDRSMPEEINRLLTDAISEYLFTTEKSANENLLREGIPPEKIHFVGNVMIDTLLKHRDKAARSQILTQLRVRGQSYGLVTLHRPGNVDCPHTLEAILSALHALAQRLPILFPCHPRTREKMDAFHLTHYFTYPTAGALSRGIYLYEPLGYLDFLKLMAEAKLVLTDSGGIQEETTILGVPCLSLRENTERPETVTVGTNTLVGAAREQIVAKALEILSQPRMPYRVPELWDGHAAKRIVQILSRNFGCVSQHP